MFNNKEIKSLEQKVDDLTGMLKVLLERQNSQYTDMGLKLNELCERVNDVTVDIDRIKSGLEESTELVFGSYPSYSDDDELYELVKTEVIQKRKASTSYIQRKFGIGYAHAAQLMDMLGEKGVIGPGLGAKPRVVLIKDENTV